jgi:uncharacterized protein (DUF1501 family)
MIGITGNRVRLCDGITRRDLLRVGGLSLFGLSLADVLRADQAFSRDRREKSCILFYLQGGQSQLDTWDMKPDAPDGVRSIFQPIATNVPGIQICEHMPLMAKIADKYAIIRSMAHETKNHNPGGYIALTGVAPSRDIVAFGPAPDDYPNPGSVVARMKPAAKTVPSYVQLSGPFLGDAGTVMPGVGSGFLGPKYDPLKVHADPNAPDFAVEELSLPEGVTQARLSRRRGLLKAVEGAFRLIDESPQIQRMDTFYQRAYSLLTSPEARKAFDIQSEPEEVRERYGRNTYGQRLLLARRLVEAGVRLVTVYWGGHVNAPDQYWDTHKNNFPDQKDKLLPPFDQGLSALLEDLHQRGLLETTLVVSAGEFGRTPRIGQITANAGTDATGRDHWPFCYSIVVAGGGVRGGQVIGASDETAAYPAERPVHPSDIVATIYHALGIDPHAELHDRLGRAIPATHGEAVMELFG